MNQENAKQEKKTKYNLAESTVNRIHNAFMNANICKTSGDLEGLKVYLVIIFDESVTKVGKTYRKKLNELLKEVNKKYEEYLVRKDAYNRMGICAKPYFIKIHNEFYTILHKFEILLRGGMHKCGLDIPFQETKYDRGL